MRVLSFICRTVLLTSIPLSEPSPAEQSVRQALMELVKVYDKQPRKIDPAATVLLATVAALEETMSKIALHQLTFWRPSKSELEAVAVYTNADLISRAANQREVNGQEVLLPLIGAVAEEAKRCLVLLEAEVAVQV